MTNLNKLLVIDTSYTLRMIKDRNLVESVTCRDLDGFFAHVWSVHPFATMVDDVNIHSRFGTPIFNTFGESHTFVEGKYGITKYLAFLPPVNFILSQIYLVYILRKLIINEKINMIRVGGPLYVGILGLILSRLCRVPFLVRIGANYDKIYQVTGRPIEKRLFRYRWVEKIFERYVLANADMVAGANSNNLEFAISNGANRSKTTLFRYGNLIDKRHFLPPAQREDLPKDVEENIFDKDKKTIAYIGRLQVEKHPDDVIDVFGDLCRQRDNIQLLMVGDGPLSAQLSERVKQMKITENVYFLGNKTQDWIVSALPKIDIILSPHTGRALLECALSASCVIAYDVDWQSELIENDSTGILIGYRDLHSMTIATNQLLKSEALRRTLGQNLRERALDMMSPEKLNEHERSVYRTVLGEHSRRRNAK